MKIPYRTRRALNRAGIVLLSLLLVLILVWFCWVIWIERYVVYTRDGAILDLSLSSHDLVGESALPPSNDTNVSIYYNDGSAAVETSNELTQLDGYYIDSDTLINHMSEIWEMLNKLPAGTPVMIDLKVGYGSFYYSSSLSDAVLSRSVDIEQVDELIRDMKTKGFYTIARISAFRDYNFGLNHVPTGLYMLSRAGLWADEGGCYWLDPTNASTLTWITSIINEVKGLGFNEVVLADFRFPNSDKYIFKGDKDAALLDAANTLLANCGSNTFTLSFAVNSAAFPLPEGRSRIFLENVNASEVGAKGAQAVVQNPQVRMVFMAETNDTRFNEYGVMRPIQVAEVMEAQKAEAAKNTEAAG